jgi:hypothetical protein
LVKIRIASGLGSKQIESRNDANRERRRAAIVTHALAYNRRMRATTRDDATRAPPASLPRVRPAPLLGGRTPAAFLRRFWHKEALVIRGALPGFTGLLDRDALFALAQRDDVESRLVVRSGRRATGRCWCRA